MTQEGGEKMSGVSIHERVINDWAMLAEALDYVGRSRMYLYRGQEQFSWDLKTSLEREFEGDPTNEERLVLEHFVRHASVRKPNYFKAADSDAAAWLGLLQHYGGPTRLLDVTRSPYVALFFALEPRGKYDRALWAIDQAWCQSVSANLMHAREGGQIETYIHRVLYEQAELVSSLVRGSRAGIRSNVLQPFRLVFPVSPWKPDARQIAQQAEFLCPADVSTGFMANLVEMPGNILEPEIWKFRIPGGLRTELLQRLELMNISAASLFPDLGGLARSARNLPLWKELGHTKEPPPWLMLPDVDEGTSE